MGTGSGLLSASPIRGLGRGHRLAEQRLRHYLLAAPNRVVTVLGARPGSSFGYPPDTGVLHAGTRENSSYGPAPARSTPRGSPALIGRASRTTDERFGRVVNRRIRAGHRRRDRRREQHVPDPVAAMSLSTTALEVTTTGLSTPHCGYGSCSSSSDRGDLPPRCNRCDAKYCGACVSRKPRQVAPTDKGIHCCVWPPCRLPTSTCGTSQSRRDTVTRLRHPVPADGRKVPAGWWPPLMLDPGWIRENHHRFDVFHVHFGSAAIGPAVSDVYHRWARRAAAPRATWGSRLAERIRIAQAHRAVYESVLR